MSADPDIFLEAAKRVANKGVLTRIAHSGSLHSFRSAVSSKGSFGSKLLKGGLAVGRSALQLIPIPVVASLASAVESKVEGWARSKHHERNLGKSVSSADKVKFTLKELSVEELDRYRWKVHASLTELNAKISGIDQSSQTCAQIFEVALAVEQANRRIKKLKEQMMGIQAAVQLTNDWLAECEAGIPNPPTGYVPTSGVLGVKNQLQKIIADRAQRWSAFSEDDKQTMAGQHKAVCPDWCQFTVAGGMNESLATARQHAAAVVRTLTSPFSYENFLTVQSKDYAVAKD